MSTPTASVPLCLPRSRGPLSEWVIERLRGEGHPADDLPAGEPDTDPPDVVHDPFGEDAQLALYLAYEGHFGSIGDIDEWDAGIISLRTTLEDAFVAELRERRAQARSSDSGPPDVRTAIPALIANDDAPSLAAYMERCGTMQLMRDIVMHRSAYQLKEGDAHSLGIPRLRGRAKQILVEIQSGEYGADAPGRTMHSELFAQTMRELDLDDRPNAYLDTIPASALMVSNLISMFGLHRRWRGALVGHLTVFEMTSVVPMGQYANALRRLGATDAATRFYDVHVMADVVHEEISLDMASELAAAEPELIDDIMFGAEAALIVEREFSQRLLRTWGSCSLAA